MPRARGRTLVELCGCARRRHGAPRRRRRPRRGLGAHSRRSRASARGPSSYVRMRALGDPDAFLPGDLALRRALARAGSTAVDAARHLAAQPWRPYRSYAMLHLWTLRRRTAPPHARPRRAPRERDDHHTHRRDDPLGGGRVAARDVPARRGRTPPSSRCASPGLDAGGRCPSDWVHDARHACGAASQQLAEYFDGTRQDFDLALRPARHAVPAARCGGARRTSPSATTASYRDVATAIGNPRATRAVGHGEQPQPDRARSSRATA